MEPTHLLDLRGLDPKIRPDWWTAMPDEIPLRRGPDGMHWDVCHTLLPAEWLRSMLDTYPGDESAWDALPLGVSPATMSLWTDHGATLRHAFGTLGLDMRHIDQVFTLWLNVVGNPTLHEAFVAGWRAGTGVGK